MKLIMKLAYKILEGELCASVSACINIQRRRCRTVHDMGTLRMDVVRARYSISRHHDLAYAGPESASAT